MHYMYTRDAASTCGLYMQPWGDHVSTFGEEKESRRTCAPPQAIPSHLVSFLIITQKPTP